MFWIFVNVKLRVFVLFHLRKKAQISTHCRITHFAYSQKRAVGFLFPLWALWTTLERKGHFLAFIYIVWKYGVIIISHAFFGELKFWNAPLWAARTKIYIPLVVINRLIFNIGFSNLNKVPLRYWLRLGPHGLKAFFDILNRFYCVEVWYKNVLSKTWRRFLEHNVIFPSYANVGPLD